MSARSSVSLTIALISLALFLIIFFIVLNETGEVVGSLSAAILGTLLATGTLIICYWIYRVFAK